MHGAEHGGEVGGDSNFVALLTAAQTGDPTGFDGLVRLTHGRVLSFTRARRAADPEGLANEVLAQMCQSISSFQGNEAQFRAWVFTIARHRLIDEHRRSLRQVDTDAFPAEEPPGTPGTNGIDHIDDIDQRQRVEDLLRSLTDEQREVVLLRILGGLTVDETAEVVGRRPGAVRALQHRALRQLRRQLDADLVGAMAR